MQSPEVSFIKILCRIWKLPHASHTVVEFTALLVCSLFNQVLHSNKLLCSAEKCSNTVRETFRHSSSVLCYTSVGYNKLVGPKFAKVYSEADVETGAILQSIKSSQSIKIISDPVEVVQTQSCNY